ncbi:hypothetical protein [Deinococcus yavapaiensis]|uniref:Uncharacterized protein n=1 Tax=Deinococcus yavapaiensis KR-236 TaxID=694435 RepID=A0A318SJS0_9DEIO|nr:hypothetical protein [Deinococcus yavapaiensis]PYE54536.1 hypothetical protein DES52_105174 [Deinococcus yavapaiensis KR-236]
MSVDVSAFTKRVRNHDEFTPRSDDVRGQKRRAASTTACDSDFADLTRDYRHLLAHIDNSVA